MVKGRAAKVDESDLGALEHPHLPSLLPILLRHVVFEVVAAKEQDVLGLEVRVRESVVVKEVDGETKLVGDLPHVLDGVGGVVVLFEEVKNTLTYKAFSVGLEIDSSEILPNNSKAMHMCPW